MFRGGPAGRDLTLVLYTDSLGHNRFAGKGLLDMECGDSLPLFWGFNGGIQKIQSGEESLHSKFYFVPLKNFRPIAALKLVHGLSELTSSLRICPAL